MVRIKILSLMTKSHNRSILLHRPDVWTILQVVWFWEFQRRLQRAWCLQCLHGIEGTSLRLRELIWIVSSQTLLFKWLWNVLFHSLLIKNFPIIVGAMDNRNASLSHIKKNASLRQIFTAILLKLYVHMSFRWKDPIFYFIPLHLYLQFFVFKQMQSYFKTDK